MTKQNCRTDLPALEFEIWNLRFIWNLEFGIWNLRYQLVLTEGEPQAHLAQAAEAEAERLRAILSEQGIV
ncbi:MAG: hypothetical protein DRI57_21520 [Deltaproteobacteria bacterium]|nr:MAG: hypothetical protein DRI57_21520 [Deltaproteobacteria bacterium]